MGFKDHYNLLEIPIMDSYDEGAWPGYLRVLRRRIMSLPIRLSRDTGMVCGGSLLRAIIGDSSALDVDIDIFTFDVAAHEEFAAILLQAHKQSTDKVVWATTEDHNETGSAGPNSTKYKIKGVDGKFFIVDLIKPLEGRMTLDSLMEGFDVNASKVATDGDTVIFHSRMVKTCIENKNLMVEPNSLHEGNIRVEDRYLKYYELGFRERRHGEFEFYKYFHEIEQKL